LPADRFKGSHNPFYRAWSKLPLLSWEQAALWPEAKIANEVESYISTEAVVTSTAFAVKMEDSTMLPRYTEGSILIFEPSIPARNNDFAAVIADDEKRMQFKQVLYDGDDLYLKPLNPDFQIRNLGKKYRILGTLVQALTEYYQDRLPKEDIQYLSNRPPVKKRRDETVDEF
jgi:SOS-response transcriptional repressor LexA